VPPALRPLVERAASVTELNDWLAAAAMLRWVHPEPFEQQTFVQSMARDPKRAALALARAVAARMEPPERSREWRNADRLGLALQLALGLACLGVRALLVVWLAGQGPAIEPPLWVAASSLLDLPLFASGSLPVTGLPAVAACLVIVLWHAFELGVLPRYFERIRRWPAQDARLPVPLSWRIDAFQIAWCLQASVLAVAAMARMVEEVFRPGITPGLETIAGFVAFAVALAVTARACVQRPA
jgi:hypothetical protein